MSHILRIYRFRIFEIGFMLYRLISYHGSVRLVEPYSLRYPSRGNELLHVQEIEKNGMPSNTHKAYKTHEIEFASISDRTFAPRWAIEL